MRPDGVASSPDKLPLRVRNCVSSPQLGLLGPIAGCSLRQHMTRPDTGRMGI
jgi:hypothetical protein